MKKYKHKINGSIAEFVFTKSLTKDCFYSVKHKEGFTHIPIEFIENSNDWEEVKEEPFIQQYGRVDRVKDPIETIISDKYPIKNMIKAKTYETLAQKLFTSSIIYTATDGISIREGSKTTLYLLNKDDLSIVKPFYKVDIFNFSKQDKEVASRYLTFTSEENRDKYIKENSNKPVFVSADGVDMYKEDLTFSVLSRNTWEEKRIRVNNFITAMHKDWIHFRTKEARQEYIDNNKPRFSLADIEKLLNGMIISYTPINKENIINRLKKLGK